RSPLRGATEGWSVSLGDLLEHLDVQRLVGDDLLQSVVLLFQRLQPLGLLALHAAVLGSPATQGGFADLQGLQYLADALASRQHGVGVAELFDDLFSRVAFSFLAQ